MEYTVRGVRVLAIGRKTKRVRLLGGCFPPHLSQQYYIGRWGVIVEDSIVLGNTKDSDSSAAGTLWLIWDILCSNSPKFRVIKARDHPEDGRLHLGQLSPAQWTLVECKYSPLC